MNLRHFLNRILGLRSASSKASDPQPTETGGHLSKTERSLIRERAKRSFARAFNRRASGL